jgi:phage terminase small subunit
MPSGKLTSRQEAFSLEYVRCGNASAAYRSAYDASRMSPKTIHEAASRLLNNSKVIARVKELRAAVAEEAVIDEAKTLRVMEAIAHFDVADLYDDAGNLRPVRDLPWETRMAISSVKTRRLPGKSGTIEEVRLLNRNAALDALVRLQGLAGRTRIEGLAEAETLTDQGRAVIRALAAGTLSPTTAASVLGAIAAQSQITKIDELEKRVAELEHTAGSREE